MMKIMKLSLTSAMWTLQTLKLLGSSLCAWIANSNSTSLHCFQKERMHHKCDKHQNAEVQPQSSKQQGWNLNAYSGNRRYWNYESSLSKPQCDDWSGHDRQQDKYERLTLHSIYRENWKSDSPDLECSSNKMKSNESQKLGQQFLNLQTFKYHLVQIKCSKVSNARFIFVFHWICHVEASVDGPNLKCNNSFIPLPP